MNITGVQGSTEDDRLNPSLPCADDNVFGHASNAEIVPPVGFASVLTSHLLLPLAPHFRVAPKACAKDRLASAEPILYTTVGRLLECMSDPSHRFFYIGAAVKGRDPEVALTCRPKP
jgi:hypothetical protein